MLGAPACFIFLLCQLTGPAASGIPKKLVGAIGGSVIFPLNLSVNLVDSIIWVFNSTTLITIQPKTGSIIVTQKRNKERVNFPHEGYSLKLSRLKKNDSGIYRVEIHSSTLQEPLTQEYELRVYEHYSRGKPGKYRLFHCAHTPKGNRAPLPAHVVRYTKVIYL
uniref:SLAM family member 7 n=1 Tax=Moschus moschiferus TaxID=68415 RepID=A0A8C6FTZ4_MOSMO